MNQLKEKECWFCEINGYNSCDKYIHNDILNKQAFSKKTHLQYLVQDKNEEKLYDSDSDCEYSEVVDWGNINNESVSRKKRNKTLPWRRWFSNKIKRKPKNNSCFDENNYYDKVPVTRKAWQE